MSTYSKFHDYISYPATVRFFKSVDTDTKELFHNIIDFGLDYFNSGDNEDERINNELFSAIAFCKTNGGVTQDWTMISKSKFWIYPELRVFHHGFFGWTSTPFSYEEDEEEDYEEEGISWTSL